jgi:hypothetical protein
MRLGVEFPSPLFETGLTVCGTCGDIYLAAAIAIRLVKYLSPTQIVLERILGTQSRIRLITTSELRGCGDTASFRRMVTSDFDESSSTLIVLSPVSFPMLFLSKVIDFFLNLELS